MSYNSTFAMSGASIATGHWSCFMHANYLLDIMLSDRCSLLPLHMSAQLLAGKNYQFHMFIGSGRKFHLWGQSIIIFHPLVCCSYSLKMNSKITPVIVCNDTIVHHSCPLHQQCDCSYVLHLCCFCSLLVIGYMRM